MDGLVIGGNVTLGPVVVGSVVVGSVVVGSVVVGSAVDGVVVGALLAVGDGCCWGGSPPAPHALATTRTAATQQILDLTPAHRPVLAFQ
ncbi:hypothetical protein DMH04_20005 [Kibdelosporangium aridum]|uniref:Uncharacterized protein n=1 Tax=Kibdelosporangium aridum TaxID=2030 RepID=A0A428Z9N4_KIBAR|nr:hypothetical protein [Kibdelosporangium aridum]RSM84764.1 hypothetical protein DMH04_20005 [Kibdelosporangium aridum]